MSMLSEKKRRAKWSLNPRGHLWTQDENKFGQKMLEKMGWEKGDGLGSEKQGITDIITVKSIDENQGLGFKGNKDEWIAHQDDFASVLADLSQHHSNAVMNEEKQGEEQEGDQVVEASSLESKSKSAKKRIHYHKFAKSKDTSKYSSSDLNSILGSEVVKKKRKLKEDESSKEVVVPLPSSAEPEKSESGLVVIRGGSIQDYFARKMEEIKNRAKLNANSNNQVPEITKSTNNEEGVESSKALDTPSLPTENKSINGLDNEEAESVSNESRNKSLTKKKSKRKSDLCETESKRVEDTQVEPSVKKKKKSKRKLNVEKVENIHCEIESKKIDNQDESPVKKKKKLDDGEIESEECQVNITSTKKRKKSKKRKSNGENLESNDQCTSEISNHESSTKKSKKKRKKSREESDATLKSKADLTKQPEEALSKSQSSSDSKDESVSNDSLAKKGKKKKQKKVKEQPIEDKEKPVCKTEKDSANLDTSITKSITPKKKKGSKNVKSSPPKKDAEVKVQKPIENKPGVKKTQPVMAPLRRNFNNFKKGPSNLGQEEKDKLQYDNEMKSLKRALLQKPVKELEIGFKGTNYDKVPGYGNKSTT